MNAYIHTSLVGGTDGELFNDVLKLSNPDGRCFPTVPMKCARLNGDIVGELTVDAQDPIRRIDVSHGWEVCSISCSSLSSDSRIPPSGRRLQGLVQAEVSWHPMGGCGARQPVQRRYLSPARRYVAPIHRWSQ